MAEVEPQPAGRDQRTGLTGVLAEHLLQRPVHDVRGGVGARGRITAAHVDRGVGDLARADLPGLDGAQVHRGMPAGGHGVGDANHAGVGADQRPGPPPDRRPRRRTACDPGTRGRPGLLRRPRAVRNPRPGPTRSAFRPGSRGSRRTRWAAPKSEIIPRSSRSRRCDICPMTRCWRTRNPPAACPPPRFPAGGRWRPPDPPRSRCAGCRRACRRRAAASRSPARPDA